MQHTGPFHDLGLIVCRSVWILDLRTQNETADNTGRTIATKDEKDEDNIYEILVPVRPSTTLLDFQKSTD
jgi:hypothetical protein